MSQRDRYLAREITHDEYYGMLVEFLGEAAVRQCLPAGLDELRIAYATNKHFNNIALARWDGATQFVRQIPRNLDKWAELTGTRGSSLSDNVCILKCAARRWVLASSPSDPRTPDPSPASTPASGPASPPA